MKRIKSSLNTEWMKRMDLYAKGDALQTKGDALRAEGNKLRAESDEIYAKGKMLQAKGDALQAKGDTLWAEAIIAKFGNIIMEWKNWNAKKQSYECHLENGEVYKP